MQVIDLLGHQLSNQEIHLTFNIPNFTFPSAGVYVMRLISGENVKVQKVVVR